MKLRALIIVAALTVPFSITMGQDLCFDSGFTPGTRLRVYDSSVFVPPGTLRKALAPMGGGRITTDVEVRTETWEVLDSTFVRELTVSWSRFEHQYPVFVPDSLKARPEVGSCYRLIRSPGMDTTFSYCDGTAIPRTRQKFLGYSRATPMFPELLLRVFHGTCLTEDDRERIVENFHSVFPRKKYTVYSDVEVDWKDGDEEGRVEVTLNFIQTMLAVPDITLEMNMLYEIVMVFDASTSRLLEIHSNETTMGPGDLPGDASDHAIHSEQHLWIEWL